MPPVCPTVALDLPRSTGSPPTRHRSREHPVSVAVSPGSRRHRRRVTRTPVISPVRGTAHLRASVLGSSHKPFAAHAATPALARALPDEDEEGLEVSASLCAADASLVLLAEPEASGLADRRIVIAADVDAENVRELPVEGDVLPGTIEVVGEIAWEDVAALLVDEPEAESDVRAARLGDEDAFERAADADLLWYDVTEREALAESLGV